MRNIMVRIISLLLLLASISSCGMNSWRRYNSRDFYGYRRHYSSYHEHHNRDW